MQARNKKQHTPSMGERRLTFTVERLAASHVAFVVVENVQNLHEDVGLFLQEPRHACRVRACSIAWGAGSRTASHTRLGDHPNRKIGSIAFKTLGGKKISAPLPVHNTRALSSFIGYRRKAWVDYIAGCFKNLTLPQDLEGSFLPIYDCLLYTSDAADE